MIRYIELTQGKKALIDDDDFDALNQYKWTANKRTNSRWYAHSCFNKKVILMHRIIVNCPDGLVVDHINHDGLDNRKENLRICTQKENAHNRRPRFNKTTPYIGVFAAKDGLWGARININSSIKYLGIFDTMEEAARVYNNAALEYRGEFAFLNKTDCV